MAILKGTHINTSLSREMWTTITKDIQIRSTCLFNPGNTIAVPYFKLDCEVTQRIDLTIPRSGPLHRQYHSNADRLFE